VTTRSRVWAVLERYYDLRNDVPVSSPLGSINSGGCDQVVGGVDARTAWMCDVGTALAGLNAAELEAVELYYHEHRAWEDADAARRNAALDVYRSGPGADFEVSFAQRSKREWRRIADRHQRELRRIRDRAAYRTAMNRLEISIPIVLLMGGHRDVVDPSVYNSQRIS
jgi:hypothetical protein